MFQRIRKLSRRIPERKHLRRGPLSEGIEGTGPRRFGEMSRGTSKNPCKVEDPEFRVDDPSNSEIYPSPLFKGKTPF